jgi:transposase
MLTDLESVFRSLKSELGLRPIFHKTEERTEGHLFITVLAYQFVQVIRRKLRSKGSFCPRRQHAEIIVKKATFALVFSVT